MSRRIFLFYLCCCVWLLIFTGVSSCSQNPDAAPSNKASTGIATTTVSDSISGSGELDKFALWTGETQLRGANIYQRVVYPDVFDDRWAWGDGPLGPVFTQEDFESLSTAGANLVVLSHAGLFDDNPPYALNIDVQDNLDRFIQMAEKADMFVVIAFRTGPGRSEFSFFGVDENDDFGMSHLNQEVWIDADAQEKWVEMWRYTASRYRNIANVAGYELMVEPDSNGLLDIWEPEDFYAGYKDTTHDWNQLYPRISRAIREVDTDTPILIGGLSWSQVKWLSALVPTGDTRTVYTVHQYEPQQQYTHQWRDDTGQFQNEYPGRFDTNWDDIDDDFNREWINNLMVTVDEFKTKYGVPVAVTEFGGVRWEPGIDHFIDDEMTFFEERGMNYAIWSWQPASEGYNWVQNDFNFRFGPEPDNLSDTDSSLYNFIKKHWSYNSVRPSDFR